MAKDIKVTGQLLPWEEDARDSVERNFARRLARLDATLKLAIKLLERSDSVDVTPSRTKSRDSVLVVMGLYAKAVKTTRAIRIVASASLVEDGFVLCRTLLETAVAVLYILQKHTPRRADEYLAHVLKRDQKVMAKWKDTHGLKRLAKPIDKLITKHLLAYSHLGPARLKELRRWYSGDETIEDTFKRIGLNLLYQTFYVQVAGVQHVSDLPRHVEVGEKGALSLSMGSSDAGAMNLLLERTNAILWVVMQRVSEKIGLGYEAEIAGMNPNPEGPAHSLLRAWSQRMQARRSASRKP